MNVLEYIVKLNQYWNWNVYEVMCVIIGVYMYVYSILKLPGYFYPSKLFC